MSERTLQALRGRINARLQTSAISRDRASAAGREVVALCRQSDVETLEWVLSEIDAVLATPEPGGEGGTLESRAYDIAHWIAMEARVAESLDRSVAPIESEGARRIVALASARPTPAASEDVRERVVWLLSQWVDELEMHWEDPEDDVEPAGVGQIADEILALLRTPRGEGPVVHIPDDAEYRDDGSVHWRVRLPAGAASGEGEAMDADEMWNHWTSGHEDAALQGLRTATDDEAHRFLGMVADWQRCPKPSDHDAIAALRSEAQGEGWQVTEPARDIVRREMPETRATVREAIRAARRGEGGGE